MGKFRNIYRGKPETEHDVYHDKIRLQYGKTGENTTRIHPRQLLLLNCDIKLDV